jgi:hypothetical protein
VQRLARGLVELDRRHAPALEERAEIAERRQQVFHRFRQIGLEIGASGDALFRLEID